MRASQELDVRALYMGAVTSMASSADGSSGQSGGGERTERSKNTSEQTPVADTGMIGYGRVDENDHTVAEKGRRITFGTYFNAFPASYWRRWTDHRTVRLVLRARGEGALIIYRSTARGHVIRVDSITLDGDEAVTITRDLTLDPFIDGGWYWFDLEAGDREAALESAEWMIETDRQQVGRVSIGITTFNRPDFCSDQLVALSKDPSTLEILDDVFVVDQGNQKVVDTPEYAEAKAVLGDRLHVIDQPNLGGSGGFSRAMYETVQRGQSDYVLLLDDDVVCELEGIKRAVAFSDLARRPTIVGGHMFSLYDRTVMHAYGEA
ncbi:MAG: glycosyltransferase, partial [Nocardioidaceae bacterium]|nr:glycosyltransferase [Nocardioidaceae bacterium]